jgi:hypothetical protein
MSSSDIDKDHVIIRNIPYSILNVLFVVGGKCAVRGHLVCICLSNHQNPYSLLLDYFRDAEGYIACIATSAF